MTRGTGKWAQEGTPHKGWACIDIEDLGEPSAICEMCETQEIRYVHIMSHSNYPNELRCGCDCAGHMEDDYVGAERRDKAMRNAASRKSRWLARSWRISANGNPFINTSDGYNVVVFPKNGGWGFCVTNRSTDYKLPSKKFLASQDAAKLRAFDAIVWMKDREL